MLDRLAEIQDPRNDKGKRHPLNSILALNIVGFMSGHKGWTSTVTWARSEPALVQALGWTHKKSPCSATGHNVLKVLDIDAVEKTWTNWVEDVCPSQPASLSKF